MARKPGPTGGGPPLRLPPGRSADAAGYAVGYAKPPEQNRFRPGQSGNPKGRPKGARNKAPRLNEERLKSIVMEEAYRTIKVNDGPRQVSMQVAQAVVRAISLKALKGQHRAQRLFAELLGQTEASHKALHDEWLRTAMDYKLGWEREIERCKQLGLPAPDPVPHPDHIDMDMRTGEIVIDGPMTPSQREAGRKLIEHLFESHDESEWFRKAAARSRDPKSRERCEALSQSETTRRIKLLAKVLSVPWLAREWHAARSGQRREQKNNAAAQDR
jgi:Family of unknown function (DUF5681)